MNNNKLFDLNKFRKFKNNHYDKKENQSNLDSDYFIDENVFLNQMKNFFAI